ncbi:MAG: hypothetical protein JSV83_13060 [Desulfobacterales bacterium]|nr:MAG: hypothetical protein JSV83_13060 [Desulfobacterales bacterium]
MIRSPNAESPTQKNSDLIAQRHGFASGCLIAVVVVVLIIVGAGIFVAKNFKSWAAEGITAAMSMMIEESDLPEVERFEIIEILNQVKEEYLAGDITIEELGHILEAMTSCPAIAMGIVIQFEASYVAISSLSDGEKNEATLALNRFAQGLTNGLVGWEEIEDIIAPISETDAEGKQTLKDPGSVTDDEIREALAAVKRAADNAGIAEELVEVDISESFRTTIEEALARPLA